MKNKIHVLKIRPKYFKEVLNHRKNFEIRKDDRNYQVGDLIELREYENGAYTGRKISNLLIEYILRDCPEYGLQEGYCILGFRTIFVDDEDLTKALKGELLLNALPKVSDSGSNECNTCDPCDDAVSRQAVLDLVDSDWKYEGLEEPVKNLPPAAPEKEKWIEDGYYSLPCVCSYCGHEGKRDMKICPNCKKEMEVEEE